MHHYTLTFKRKFCPLPRFRSDRITPAKTHSTNHKLPEQIRSCEMVHCYRYLWSTRHANVSNAHTFVFHFFCNRHHSTYIGKPVFCDLLRSLFVSEPFFRQKHQTSNFDIQNDTFKIHVTVPAKNASETVTVLQKEHCYRFFTKCHTRATPPGDKK